MHLRQRVRPSRITEDDGLTVSKHSEQSFPIFPSCVRWVRFVRLRLQYISNQQCPIVGDKATGDSKLVDMLKSQDVSQENAIARVDCLQTGIPAPVKNGLSTATGPAKAVGTYCISKWL